MAADSGEVPARGRVRSALDLLATLSIIAVSLTTIWYLVYGSRIAPAQNPQKKSSVPAVPTQALAMDGAPLLGSAAAGVGIVEFADFECPFCAKFAHETLPSLERDYLNNGRVVMAFRNLPLSIHRNAKAAAESAVCANQQDKFWPYHGLLYRNARALDDANLRRFAVATGLSLDKFDSCRSSGAFAGIESDTSLASTLRVAGTPTFFIGTLRGGQLKTAKVLVGAVPYDDLKAVLDALLQGRITAQ